MHRLILRRPRENALLSLNIEKSILVIDTPVQVQFNEVLANVCVVKKNVGVHSKRATNELNRRAFKFNRNDRIAPMILVSGIASAREKEEKSIVADARNRRRSGGFKPNRRFVLARSQLSD